MPSKSYMSLALVGSFSPIMQQAGSVSSGCRMSRLDSRQSRGFCLMDHAGLQWWMGRLGL